MHGRDCLGLKHMVVLKKTEFSTTNTSAFQRFLKSLIHHLPALEITQYVPQSQDNQERGKVLIYKI